MNLGAAAWARAQGGRWTGSLLAAHLSSIAPSVTVLAASSTARRLGEIRAQGASAKLVLCYWIEDAVPLILAGHHAANAAPSFREDMVLTCDDTLGGHVAASAVGALGGSALILPWFDHVRRLRALQRLITLPAPVGIAVDGHGPYGNVGLAFARLLEHRRCLAVPVAAPVDRAWRLRLGARIAIPRRRARIALTVGDPIIPVGTASELRISLQEGLHRVREAAVASLEKGRLQPGGNHG